MAEELHMVNHCGRTRTVGANQNVLGADQNVDEPLSRRSQLHPAGRAV